MRTRPTNIAVLKSKPVAWYTDDEGHRITKVTVEICQRYIRKSAKYGKPYTEYTVHGFIRPEGFYEIGVTRKLSKAYKIAEGLANRILNS